MAYTPDNNPYIPGDPYSYDLKWQVDNIKHMQTRFAELDEQVQEATDQADRSEQEADRAVEEANRSRDEADRADSEALVSEGYAKGTQDGEAVTSGSPYFENNSKYYSEESAASAQASAGSASEAADYAAHIADPVSGLVTSWLNQHITQPTTPAIDTSLTVAGAAADAKAAGDYVRLLSDTIFDIYSFNPVFVNGEINGRTGVITPNPNRAIPQTPQFIFIAKDQTISITGKQMAVLQFTAPKFSNDTYIGMTGWVNTFTAPSNMYIVITAAELALANPIDPAEVPGALSFRSLDDAYDKIDQDIKDRKSVV